MDLSFPSDAGIICFPLPPPAEGGDDTTDVEMRDGDAPESTQQPPANPAEERRLVFEKEQASAGLRAGGYYCLVDRRWYLEWRQYVGDESVQSPKRGPVDLVGRERSWSKDRPGPVTNSSLADSEPSKLKRDINEHEHYELVTEEVWGLLHGWYSGGPVFKRRAIQQPSGAVVVELYGIPLHVYKSSAPSQSTTMTESKTTSVEAFKRRACEEFGLQYDKVRIWDYFNKRKYANLEDSLSKSLDNCRIYDANDILLEEQNADGTWPPDEQAKAYIPSTSYGSSYSTYGSRGADADVPTTGCPLVKGATGLQNLGNTCFMNSSIQCLSSIPELREYFLTEAYKENLNEGAFKTKGKLAEAYSKLLTHIWNPNVVQVAPRNFKWQIGQFAEQFAGYGQQDSMEFIEYVLDGLKEDVNLVQGAKPFVELKEAEGRPDPVVAEEAAQNYYMRNNSRVDELFLGFFKSTVTCPQAGCGRVSVKFDPFSSVKLSLVSSVEDRSTSFDVSVVLLASPQAPVQKHSVAVSKFGSVGELVEAAAKKAGLEGHNCLLTEIYSKKIYKIFEKHDAVEHIGSHDVLVLYELPERSDEKCELVIHCRQMKQQASLYSSSSYSKPELLGVPFPASVSRNIAGRDLIEVVKTEFSKRIGSSLEGKWRLLRTHDKFNIQDCRDVVNDDSEQLNLGFRHYVVADFDEDFQTPDVLTNMLEERSLGYGRASAGGGSRGTIELFKCFQMFTETDKLSATDTWYCNKCKEHREAFKKMELWSLPPVLVLQLKRFTYTTYTRDRLDTAVNFPLEGLDLGPFVIGPDASKGVYDLIAVSKHMGGLGGGHYVAYARSSENGKWYYYNDSSVTESSARDVAEDQVGAYVLFYIRRDRRPASWGEAPSPTLGL